MDIDVFSIIAVLLTWSGSRTSRVPWRSHSCWRCHWRMSVFGQHSDTSKKAIRKWNQECFNIEKYLHQIYPPPTYAVPPSTESRINTDYRQRLSPPFYLYLFDIFPSVHLFGSLNLSPWVHGDGLWTYFRMRGSIYDRVLGLSTVPHLSIVPYLSVVPHLVYCSSPVHCSLPVRCSPPSLLFLTCPLWIVYSRCSSLFFGQHVSTLEHIFQMFSCAESEIHKMNVQETGWMGRVGWVSPCQGECVGGWVFCELWPPKLLGHSWPQTARSVQVYHLSCDHYFVTIQSKLQHIFTRWNRYRFTGLNICGRKQLKPGRLKNPEGEYTPPPDKTSTAGSNRYRRRTGFNGKPN